MNHASIMSQPCLTHCVLRAPFGAIFREPFHDLRLSERRRPVHGIRRAAVPLQTKQNETGPPAHVFLHRTLDLTSVYSGGGGEGTPCRYQICREAAI